MAQSQILSFHKAECEQCLSVISLHISFTATKHKHTYFFSFSAYFAESEWVLAHACYFHLAHMVLWKGGDEFLQVFTARLQPQVNLYETDLRNKTEQKITVESI